MIGVEREIESLRAELAQEIEKRSRIREAQMRAYDTGEATRRRTTTRNANADWCNERIESLRTQIRAMETQIGVARAGGAP